MVRIQPPLPYFYVTKEANDIGSLIDKYSEEELRNIVANSFSFKEVLLRLGYSTQNGNNSQTLKKRLRAYNISTNHFTYKKNKTDWTDEEIFCENSRVSQSKLRRTFKERDFVPYKCNICGLGPFWKGKPLTLRLDHINGYNKDNRLENLQWVCPNCDSQQDTFGAKNRKTLNKQEILLDEKASDTLAQAHIFYQVQEPTREDLKNKLWELKNFTQVADYYNVSSTQIRRWCRKHDLPATVNILRHTSEQGWLNENWNDDYKPNVFIVERSIPCCMIDKDTGEVIEEFSSRQNAAQYLGKGKSGAIEIGRVCKGERKTAYGYKWKDKKDILDTIKKYK